jgi:hypothetical protein
MTSHTDNTQQGWQPIETAPKDGRWILTCRKGEGPEHWEICAHEPSMWPTYELVEGDIYRRVDKPIHDWRGASNFHRATHWMPLPPPPGEGE